MINVSMTKANSMIYVSVYGHSGIKGESLSCAGASTLFAALSASVEEKCDYICKSGYGYLCFPVTDDNTAFSEMFRRGLLLLKNKFPDEFSIN